MRITISLLFVFISSITYSQEKQGEHKKLIEPDASFSLNSNGIASIPAFSLGKPAFICSVNLVKGRFSYDPVLAYGLAMKPWFIDNWFHYKIIACPKFDLKAGVNFSTYCSGLSINGIEILKAERYFTFSMTATYKYSSASAFSLDYWSDNGQETGSLSGHFICLTYDRSEIPIGKKGLAGVNIMLFYINYTGENDGLFVTPKIAFSLRKIPVSIFFQATQAIQSNISPWPGFRWNVGISYDL
jgi:hypothetical protein